MQSRFRVCQGNLVKLGYKSGKWQQRRFDLLGPNIVYYNGFGVMRNGDVSLSGASVELATPDDVIDPLSTTIVPLHGSPLRMQYTIKLTANFAGGKTNRRVYYLALLNEEDRQSLFNALSANIVALSGGSQALPSSTSGGSLQQQTQQTATMNAISNALANAPSNVTVEKTNERDQTRINEVGQMLAPGVAGFLVTTIVPGGLGEGAGLRTHCDLILKLNGVAVGTGGEPELATLINTKKRAFAETGTLTLTVLDTNSYQLREVTLKAPSHLSGEEAANAPLGTGFSYVARPAEKEALFAVGWKKEGLGFVSTGERYPIYVTNPRSEDMDIYVEGWRATVSGRMVNSVKIGHVPLYDYHGFPAIWVKVWKPVDGGWFSTDDFLPLPIRD